MTYKIVEFTEIADNCKHSISNYKCKMQSEGCYYYTCPISQQADIKDIKKYGTQEQIEEYTKHVTNDNDYPNDGFSCPMLLVKYIYNKMFY